MIEEIEFQVSCVMATTDGKTVTLKRVGARVALFSSVSLDLPTGVACEPGDKIHLTVRWPEAQTTE